MSLADRMRELARKHGAKKELAEAVGVNKHTVQDWLNGSMPEAENLHRIARHYGVSMEWLLTGEGKRYDRSRIQVHCEHESTGLKRRMINGLLQIYDVHAVDSISDNLCRAIIVALEESGKFTGSTRGRHSREENIRTWVVLVEDHEYEACRMPGGPIIIRRLCHFR